MHFLADSEGYHWDLFDSDFHVNFAMLLKNMDGSGKSIPTSGYFGERFGNHEYQYN